MTDIFIGTSGVTNIINNYPQGVTSTRFNFASAFVTIMFVIFLTFLGLWLWKTGVIAGILTAFGIWYYERIRTNKNSITWTWWQAFIFGKSRTRNHNLWRNDFIELRNFGTRFEIIDESYKNPYKASWQNPNCDIRWIIFFNLSQHWYLFYKISI